MGNSPREIERANEALIAGIFKNKDKFHQQQAQLPIEEKIMILIELQKIVLAIRPKRGVTDHRMVWRI